VHVHFQQHGEQPVALLPKPTPTPGKPLAAPALSVVTSLLPLPSTSRPCRVLKTTQGANRPVGGPSGVLLSRAGAASSTSKSQENGFKKTHGGGEGWHESQRGAGAGAAEEVS